MKKQDTVYKRVDFINISNREVNEWGVYSSCSLLQEIVRANDQTVTEAFGTSSIAEIHALHYSIEFIAPAVAGDTLSIESSYCFTRGDQLQVRVAVTKLKKRSALSICTGNFIFINTNSSTKTKTHHADTVFA